MKSIQLFIFICLFALTSINPIIIEAKVKNVIIMIPDGTSNGVLSLSRWYNAYKNDSIKHVPALAIDSIICGLVRTHSSNAPIGDSAPTSSWYSTGQSSQTGFIAMYPLLDSINDLVEIDSNKRFQPMMTVLEAAKLSRKKTGLVFTCYFTHATPADFSAHWYDRNKNSIIAKQMVYNDIDLVFGGGNEYLNNDLNTYLTNNDYNVLQNDIYGFRKLPENNSTKAWALFKKHHIDYDFDRDINSIPSLSEMTDKALKILSKNENGFFLMVEGSAIDFAAHANDPIGIISEFLAFNKSVETVLDFAKQNKETVVIICPDHGNSSISIGNTKSNKGYDKLSIHQIIKPLVDFKLTPEGITNIFINEYNPDSSDMKTFLKKYNSSIQFLDTELIELNSIYTKFNYNKDSLFVKLKPAFIKMVTSRTYIGFTTSGHTGEDVFLAVYNPDNDGIKGVVRSDDINNFLCKKIGIVNNFGVNTLNDSTEKYYSKHFEVFSEDYTIELFNNDTIYKWNNIKKSFNIGKHTKIEKAFDFKYKEKLTGTFEIKHDDIILIVKKGKNSLFIPAYKNFYIYNQTPTKQNTINIYVDKNHCFYISKQLKQIFGT